MLYQLTPVFYIKIKRKTSGILYTDFEPCCPHNLFPSFTKLLTFVQYCYLQLDHGCQKLQTGVIWSSPSLPDQILWKQTWSSYQHQQSNASWGIWWWHSTKRMRDSSRKPHNWNSYQSMTDNFISQSLLLKNSMKDQTIYWSTQMANSASFLSHAVAYIKMKRYRLKKRI